MWLNELRRCLGLSRKPSRSRRRNRPAPIAPRPNLQLESLEGRAMPAVYKVTSLADVTGAVVTTGHTGTPSNPYIAPSLRSAIAAAGAHAGGNTIELAAAGTYTLNSSLGSLDVLPGGGNLTIENISGKNAAINGDNQVQVFDINPNATSTTPFTIALQGFTIENGFTSGSGGAIALSGDASLVLTNTVIERNTAEQNGGGIAFINATGTLTVQKSTIEDNTALIDGGGIQTNGTGMMAIDSGTLITGNVADGNGGGIALDASNSQGATISVSAATISNNSAHGIGGGLFSASPGTLTITGSTVSGNKAGTSGGGYGDANGMDSLNVLNSLFEQNVAGGSGGGISFTGTTASVEKSSFRDNDALTGGGIASAGSNLILSNDLLTQNSAGQAGGAVYSQDTLFTGTNLEFLDNDAASGGGLDFSGATMNLSAATFSANAASGAGGALEIAGNGSATPSTILNSTITGNFARSGAGGIDFTAANFALSLVNDTVAGNTSVSGIGGVAFAGASNSSLSAENTIFAQNNGGDVSAPTTPVTDLGGNLIGTVVAGTGFTASTDELNANPLLGPLGANGGATVGATSDSLSLETQALLTGSPAIGKGVTGGTLAATDERGYLRPAALISDTLDIGAFDTHGMAPSTHSTMPSNGDTNPYGVAYVPSNFPSGGIFQPGALLVTNFNNAGGTQGRGTTLVQINSTGTATTLFTSKQAGLDAALGFLKAGYVIVGNVPNNNGTPGVGSLQILNKYGQEVATLTSSTYLDGPWYLTVAADTGSSAVVFVSNVLNGTVTRLNLSIGNNSVKVMSAVTIATGYGHMVSPSAFTVGPAGLAYDASTGALYVASSVDDAIYAIPNAMTATTAVDLGNLVVQSQNLHGSLALILAPNGNLVVANSDAVNTDPNNPSEISEFTTSGVYLGEFAVDPNPGGAFGLCYKLVNGELHFAAVNDNSNTIDIWSE